MEVTINGEKCKVPPCTCGKCIVRRLRKDYFTPFPYAKDLASTYKNDYDWKTSSRDNPDDVYNRSKHNGFEGAYKEHIPTSLISTMKMDYKPFKVKVEDKPKEAKAPFVVPFMGRTTNQTSYPNWGAMVPTADSGENKMQDINVPLRGKSHYVENYPRYDEHVYKKGEPLDFAKATLNFYGKINPRTTYGDDYKPVDFGNKNYFPEEKPQYSCICVIHGPRNYGYYDAGMDCGSVVRNIAEKTMAYTNEYVIENGKLIFAQK